MSQPEKDSMKKAASSRRQFLKGAAAAAAAASAAAGCSTAGTASTGGATGASAPSAPVSAGASGALKKAFKANVPPYAGKVLGANDRIVCGFVGVGGQGSGAHVGQSLAHKDENNIAHAAVCDVSKRRVQDNIKKVQDGKAGTPQGYGDYRQLLERKDIDVIFCATVDHWHTKVSCDAMMAGKHVYVEKPMTRHLHEAFQIHDIAKSTGKVLQVGSQGCSDMKWHKAAEWIRAGKIGPVVMSQGSYMRNNPKGEWNYDIQPWCTPDDLNWSMWMGNEIKKQVPFNADHYFRWRKYYPYCSGLLGDLFPHKLHPYMLATGNPEFPLRVAAVGNKKVRTDAKSEGKSKTEYERDVCEIIQLIAEFPSGMVMHITSSTVNEQGTQEMIRGHKATLTMAGNKVELKPERPFAEEIDPQTSEPFATESVAAHHKNFFSAIRGTAKANAGIDLAVKVQTVISLAETSERLGIMCYFDAATRRVTDATGREIAPLSYGTTELS